MQAKELFSEHPKITNILNTLMDVIKTADWIIDLGPEGGSSGGEIVAWGTPEKIACASKSYTGH